MGDLNDSAMMSTRFAILLMICASVVLAAPVMLGEDDGAADADYYTDGPPGGKGGVQRAAGMAQMMKVMNQAKRIKKSGGSMVAPNEMDQLGDSQNARARTGMQVEQDAMARIKKINQNEYGDRVESGMNKYEKNRASHDQLFQMMAGQQDMSQNSEKLNGLTKKQAEDVTVMSLAEKLGWTDNDAVDPPTDDEE